MPTVISAQFSPPSVDLKKMGPWLEAYTVCPSGPAHIPQIGKEKMSALVITCAHFVPESVLFQTPPRFPLAKTVCELGPLASPVIVPPGGPVGCQEPVGGARPMPVPERLTVCGLPAALSVMVIVPVRLPVALGVKFTVIVQLDPAATLDPHALVCVKSPAFAPVTVILVMVRAALPVLPRVTDWAALVVLIAWFPKLSDPGDRLATGADGGGVTGPPMFPPPPQQICKSGKSINETRSPCHFATRIGPPFLLAMRLGAGCLISRQPASVGSIPKFSQ